jgi:serralysin
MANSRFLSSFVGLSGQALVDGVLSGVAWNSNTIHYAFPDSASDYGKNYSDYNEPLHHFGAFNAAMKTNVRFILDQGYGNSANDGFSVEGFTKLNIAAGSDSTSEVRYALSSQANPTAYGYYPSEDATGGDVWLGTSEPSYLKPKAGNDAWLGTIHETGHALGLKHGHETESGFPALPASKDSLEYSVMTYDTFVGDNGNSWKYEKWGAPQTFMMADIAALQYLYGADYSVQSGNTIYSWKPGAGDTFVNGAKAIDAGGDVIFATIWDGGGNDTYDLSAYASNLDIDLAAGSYSKFKGSQLADLDFTSNDPARIARGNIFNALLYHGSPLSLIENAIGGSGSDMIDGNQVANTLSGKGGNDTLSGLAGNDRLSGGAGHDIFQFAAGDDRDTIIDFRHGLDTLEFDGLAKTAKAALGHMTQSGDDVVFHFGGGDTLILAGTTTAEVSAGDILIVL